MGYKNEGNYYIPDLESKKGFGDIKYVVENR